MKAKLTLLALLLSLCQLAKAQTSDTTSYKHHFGLVASPTLHKLFTSNTTLPVGLVYKRQGSGNGMFRSTLIGSQNGYSQSIVNQSEEQNSEHTGKGFSIQLTGGYEWHIPLNNRWLLYYGVDVGPTYGQHNNESVNPYFDYNGQVQMSHSQQYRTFGAIIRPFSGIAFQVTDRLYIATETAIVASLYRSKNKMVDANTTAANYSSTERSYKTNSSSINYKPISNISLLMRF